MRRRSPPTTASDGDRSRSSPSSAPRPAADRARAGPPAPPPRALRAAVALQRAWSCSALAVWRGALEQVADAVGISTRRTRCSSSRSAFILVLLLHFSAAVSRLTDQTKVLAQRQAILEEQLREIQHQRAAAHMTQSTVSGGKSRRRCCRVDSTDASRRAVRCGRGLAWPASARRRLH